ncbi:Hypothetical predicted protein [Olea europaea subsp. europaea]|uniref:TLDc domain-containing protein n=1 Tax=Olea europaea subsp. europaea TaxID=158383 RepID=A0A8S0U3A7_OLEEU|nr:Hypothetical predicted protein [Olea europaea subsp. europaea]
MPDQKPEARPYSKEGKSIFSFILPSAGLDWFRSNNRNNEVKSLESHSFKWRSKSFLFKDKPMDRYSKCDIEYPRQEYGKHGSVRGLSQNNESSPWVENGEPGSRRSTCSSTDAFEDAADSYSFEKTMPNLTVESLFISPDLYEFFDSSLPNIVKGCQWILIYSTVRHDISLRTLIRKSADLSGPCLLITGDKQGAVFGGLLECPLKPTAKRKYQGTNQTFVFTTIYGEPRLFRPTGANRYFYLCLNDLIALGGGANFALRLNEDLLSGTSGPCETFGNLCLAHDQEFELKNVELWGFTHVSQYLN